AREKQQRGSPESARRRGHNRARPNENQRSQSKRAGNRRSGGATRQPADRAGPISLIGGYDMDRSVDKRTFLAGMTCHTKGWYAANSEEDLSPALKWRFYAG